MPEVLQDFRIRYQRGDALRSYVSINDRVDQCWSEVIPPLVSCRPWANRATSCFFSEARIAGKSMRELSATLSPDRSAAVNRQNENAATLRRLTEEKRR